METIGNEWSFDSEQIGNTLEGVCAKVRIF